MAPTNSEVMRMKTILRFFAALSSAVIALPATAALNVFACEQEWAALAQELAGDKAPVYSATNALQDVHKVEARVFFLSAGGRRYRAGKEKPPASKAFPSSCTIKTCRISSTGRECAKREASNRSPACLRRLRISRTWSSG